MNLETQTIKVNTQDRKSQIGPPPSILEEKVHDIRCKASFNFAIVFLSFFVLYLSLSGFCVRLDVVKNEDLCFLLSELRTVKDGCNALSMGFWSRFSKLREGGTG